MNTLQIQFNRGDIAAGSRDHLTCGSPFTVIRDDNWWMILKVGESTYAEELDEPVKDGESVKLRLLEPWQNIGRRKKYTGSNPVGFAMEGRMATALELLFDPYFNPMTHQERWALVNDVPDRKRRNRLAKLVRRKEAAEAMVRGMAAQ